MTTTMEPIITIRSSCVVLPAENVDTDQIIPARFLKTINREGLGEHLFADWRVDEHGQSRRDFPLNSPAAREASILVAGHNFGCGSSREHAPWALLDFGFRAIISTGFADIFRANAITNGLLPVVLTKAAHARLLQLIATGNTQVEVDLEQQRVTLPDGASESFDIEAFDKHCLLQGVDRLGFLLALSDDITKFEQQHTHGPLTQEQSA